MEDGENRLLYPASESSTEKYIILDFIIIEARRALVQIQEYRQISLSPISMD